MGDVAVQAKLDSRFELLFHDTIVPVKMTGDNMQVPTHAVYLNNRLPLYLLF